MEFSYNQQDVLNYIAAMSGGGGVGGGLGGGTGGPGGNTPNLGSTSVWVNNQQPVQHVTDQLGGLHLTQHGLAMTSTGMTLPLQQNYTVMADNSTPRLQMGSDQLQSPPLTNGFHQQVAGQGNPGLSLPLQSSTPLPQVLSAPAHAPLSFSINLPLQGGTPSPLAFPLGTPTSTFTLGTPTSTFTLGTPTSTFPLGTPVSSFPLVSPTSSLLLGTPTPSFPLHNGDVGQGMPSQGQSGVQGVSSFGTLQSPTPHSASFNAAAVGSPLGGSVPLATSLAPLLQGTAGQSVYVHSPGQTGSSQGQPGHSLALDGDVRRGQGFPGSPLQPLSPPGSFGQHVTAQTPRSHVQQGALLSESHLPLNAFSAHFATNAVPTPPPAPPLPAIPATTGCSNNNNNNNSYYNNNNNNNNNDNRSSSYDQHTQSSAMLRELNAQIEARSREPHPHVIPRDGKSGDCHTSGSASPRELPVPLPGMTGGACHTVTHDASDPGVGRTGSATAEFYSTFSRGPVPTSVPLTRTDSVGSGYSGPDSPGEGSPSLNRSLNRRLTRTDSAASVQSNSSLGSLGGTAEFYSTFGHAPSPALVRTDSVGSGHSSDSPSYRSADHASSKVTLREEAEPTVATPRVLPEVKPCYDKPRQKDLCLRCGKKVYVMEKLGPPVKDVMYHKHCFSCVVCGTTLTLKNFHHNPNDIDDLNVFCGPHTPVVKAAAMDAEAVDIRRALHVPRPRDVVNEQIRSGSSGHGLNDLESVSIRSALQAPRRDNPSYEKFQATHFNPWDT